MYSTSLGNSVMTSTSCSRGRQKLRFQISRKVRTARDGDRDCKEAPREAEPSRAAAGAGAAAAGGSCSHQGAQGSKGPPCAPSHRTVHTTVLTQPPQQALSPSIRQLRLLPRHSAYPRPPPGRGSPAPRTSLGRTAVPRAFQQGELKRSAPTRDPARRHRRGGSPGIGLRSASVCGGARARGGLGESSSKPRHNSPLPPRLSPRDAGGNAALPGLLPPPSRGTSGRSLPTHRATLCWWSPIPPGPAGRERRALEGRHGATRRRPPPSAGRSCPGSRGHPGQPHRGSGLPLPRPPSRPSALTGAGGAPSVPATSNRRKAPSSHIAAPTAPAQTRRRHYRAAAPGMPPRPRATGPAVPPPPPPGHGSAPRSAAVFHRHRPAAAPPRPRRGAGAGARPRRPRGRPVLPGAAEPPPLAAPHRLRPLLHRAPGTLCTVPCPVNTRPATTIGAVFGFSACCFRCPVPIHPFRAHLDPLPPYNSPFPTHPLHSPTDALFPLRHPVTVHPPPSPSSCPVPVPSAPAVGPLPEVSRPPRLRNSIPVLVYCSERKGAQQVWGQTLLPTQRSSVGLFCSIFKPQRPGKLELWEV